MEQSLSIRLKSAACVILALGAACGGAPKAAPVASVTVSLTSPLGVGQTTQASAVLRDANSNVLSGRGVTWTSSNAAVATLSSTGLVTAVGLGTATITATSEGMSGSADAAVIVFPVARVTVVLATSRVGIGQTTAAIATAFDATGHSLSGRVFIWTTSNAAVATVSSAGLVTATGLGTATITATSEKVPGSAVLTVTGVGAPTSMTAVSALSQTSGPGSLVVQPPAVVVKDSTGVPVPGVSVAFAVTSGGGAVGGGAAVTGADGVARASSWTLGGAGGQSVRATTPVLPATTIDFDALSRAPGAGYDVSLRFIGTMSDAQARAFVHAKERIEKIIVGDVPPFTVSISVPVADCGGVILHETVDDVVIFAEVKAIDGPGNILGQAGPCRVRSGSFIPYLGHMEFDSADLAKLEANGTLESVILHEMLHVIGFGTMWPDLGVLDTTSATDPFFTGAGARAAFRDRNGGGTYLGTPVPVENGGGASTALAHWRESVLKAELMTGYISSTGTAPLSATTIGSLGDIGYAVDLSQADPFNVSFALRASPALRTGSESFADDQGVFLGDHIRPEPPVVTDEYGNPVAR